MLGVVVLALVFLMGICVGRLFTLIERDCQQLLPAPLPIARVETIGERRRRIATSGFYGEDTRG